MANKISYKLKLGHEGATDSCLKIVKFMDNKPVRKHEYLIEGEAWNLCSEIWNNLDKPLIKSYGSLQADYVRKYHKKILYEDSKEVQSRLEQIYNTYNNER